MATLTSSLIISLIDKVTSPARTVARGIKGIGAAVTAANAGGLAKMAEANSRALAGMRASMLEAVGVGYALQRGLRAPIGAAMEFESAMADVRKVVDFDTPDQFKQMSADVRALARDMPMTAKDIATIVAAGGQSGVNRGDLLEFARVVTKVGVAWDVSAGQAGEALAKLKTALALDIPQTELLADAINHLGNNSAASARDILDVTRRVAPIASAFGLSATQAAAFGAAMVGAGFESEVASTSFRNMGRALTMGTAATKAQREALAKLGTSAPKVAQLMQKDAINTIKSIFARIRQLPKEQQAATMSQLFGDEARALAPLIVNAKLLDDTLELVGDKTKYAGSAQREYAERSKTTANNLQLLMNSINDVAISVGDALLPRLNQLIATFKPLVDRVSELVKANPDLVANIISAATALIGLTIAARAAQWSFLFLKGGVLMLARPLLAATMAAAGLGKALLITPVIRGVAAALYGARTATLAVIASTKTMSGLFMLLSGGSLLGAAKAGIIGLGSTLLGLLRPMALVRGALIALRLAVIGTGIGALLVGIAAAGLWIYNNWAGLGEFFTAFGSAFMSALGPLGPAMTPLIDAVQWLWDKVSGFLGEISPATWAAWGTAAGAAVGNLVVWFTELPSRIATIAEDLYNGGVALIGRLYDGIVERFSTIAAFFSAGMPALVIVPIVKMGPRLYEAGVGVIQSLWDGLRAKFAEVLTWVSGAVDRITGMFSGIGNKISNFFGLEQRDRAGEEGATKASSDSASPQWRPRAPLRIIGNPEDVGGKATPLSTPNGQTSTPHGGMSRPVGDAAEQLDQLNQAVGPSADLSGLARLNAVLDQTQAKVDRLNRSQISIPVNGGDRLTSAGGGSVRRATRGEHSDAGM